MWARRDYQQSLEATSISGLKYRLATLRSMRNKGSIQRQKIDMLLRELQGRITYE